MTTKTVIYKQGDTYCTTSIENYKARIRNARLIIRVPDFSSAKDIKDYYKKYFSKSDNDFIIIDD